MADADYLTPAQRKWFESVQASLQASTGRSIADWAEIARQCPETAHRKRLGWMKQMHGLGQNYASVVLNAAFPPVMSWREPDGLEAALWADPAARAVFESVRAQALTLPEVIVGQRKGFTGFSRRVQFAAIRPAKYGVRLGLAVTPETDASLVAPKNESWSERLHSMKLLHGPEDVTGLLRAAWEAS